MEQRYAEESGLEEARGVTWAKVVKRKEQGRRDVYADELMKRRSKEDRSNRETQGRTGEDKENREERVMCMDRWKDECQERIVRRVEEIVIKYIRNRFVEMEQWVECDRIREEENSKKVWDYNG